MPNDLNELDEQDIGLKMVMGSRFQDDTQSASEAKEECFTRGPEMNIRWSEPKKPKAKDAQWEPVPQYSFTQKLMTCGKKAAVYAGLCLLIFYWQSTGQMEASAAMPCMMACTALIGVTYGRVFAKEMF